MAPSFFQSCVSDGKNARMEDVLRFKVRIAINVTLNLEFSIIFSCTRILITEVGVVENITTPILEYRLDALIEYVEI